MRQRALLAGATVSFGGFVGLADGAVQRYWLGVDQGARGAIVHWLTDVIGGFGLGLTYLLVTIWPSTSVTAGSG